MKKKGKKTHKLTSDGEFDLYWSETKKKSLIFFHLTFNKNHIFIISVTLFKQILIARFSILERNHP